MGVSGVQRSGDNPLSGYVKVAESLAGISTSIPRADLYNRAPDPAFSIVSMTLRLTGLSGRVGACHVDVTAVCPDLRKDVADVHRIGNNQLHGLPYPAFRSRKHSMRKRVEHVIRNVPPDRAGDLPICILTLCGRPDLHMHGDQIGSGLTWFVISQSKYPNMPTLPPAYTPFTYTSAIFATASK